MKSVLITNFRNVSKRFFRIENGKATIEGENMSGKTNTLNAISWCLTGVDLEGANNDRDNFAIGTDNAPFFVELEFETFKVKRSCQMVDGAPKQKIYIDDEEATTIKKGEALLHAKLGLSDLVIKQTKGFDIVKFLINPCYFDTIAPGVFRQFVFKMADVDVYAIKESMKLTVQKIIKKYDSYDVYTLTDKVSKSKRNAKQTVKTLESVKPMLPNAVEDIDKIIARCNKDIVSLEKDEAYLEKYVLAVSNAINSYYNENLGIDICLLEKGVGEDVIKDVCYPILPNSKLPFSQGSFAEKTLVGIHFIKLFSNKFNIPTLPFLIDNMESMDKYTLAALETKGVEYIGAIVKA